MYKRHELSFDDVLIVPAKSNVLPNETDLSTTLTQKIKLNIPLISAAMDTVTESQMAIAMAMLGGIGVLHRNLTIQEQANEVNKVKNFNFDSSSNPNASVDNKGRLIVAAAIGTAKEDILRAEKLIESEVDAIVIDTAHGHSYKVMSMIEEIQKLVNNQSIIAGNIATKEAAIDLINLGVDAVKVGIGAGSICTTRIISGIGVPQFAAIRDVAEVCINSNICLIADGGIRNSGDVAKAIAAGADSIMIGSLFAGMDESPGEIITAQGEKYKRYRGMGSIGAMKAGSSDRYFQEKASKFVPEGVEGYVEYKGQLKDAVHQLVGGLRAAMGYTGNASIAKMKRNCEFISITASGMKEGHVHDLSFFEPAPNYSNK